MKHIATCSLGGKSGYSAVPPPVANDGAGFCTGRSGGSTRGLSWSIAVSEQFPFAAMSARRTDSPDSKSNGSAGGLPEAPAGR
jgi:hypothetical protein